MNPKKTRVVVAMSGGVDSSVAAALLVEQGYDVIGMMMRLWSEPGQEAHNRCCTPDQMADARRVADHLDIPFYVLDSKAYFRTTIVQHFIDEYSAGNTPNPCIKCNREIRFRYLLDHALALDADYLATGHYAQIRQEDGQFQLWAGVDDRKDQSYVLHVLTQASLAQVMFPLGGYTKPEVRQLAEKYGLPTASKGESMDLCFLGKDTYQNFLKRNVIGIAKTGKIVDPAGKVLGEHNGLPFYTIGQRKGLNISTPQPVFVLRKNIKTNTLVVGGRKWLGRDHLIAHTVNWVADTIPTQPVRAEVKIRYKSKAVEATVVDMGLGRARINFDQPVPGIAPGQGAVFYQGRQCIGGGIIEPYPDGGLLDDQQPFVAHIVKQP